MSQIINVGLTANDHTGDPLRDAFIKVNQNFADIDAILQDVLTTSSAIPISQVTGLQAQLTSLSNSVSLLTSDVIDINAAISSINDTLNEQNISITDLYAQLTALQTLVNTKIGDAPVDGLTYGRKDGAWVEVSGGSTGYELEELHNVSVTGATSGDTLIYNATMSVWENKKPYIKNTITLATASWTLVGSYYQSTYTNSSIRSTSYVDFTPNNASILEVTSCKMLPEITVNDGNCIFYSLFPPQSSITGENIIHI